MYQELFIAVQNNYSWTFKNHRHDLKLVQINSLPYAYIDIYIVFIYSVF